MPTSSIPLLLAGTGCLCLLAGLFGGGFTAEEVKVPRVRKLPRILSGLAGIVLIGASVWLYTGHPSEAAPQPTEMAKSIALASQEAPSQVPPAPSPLPATNTAVPVPSIAATMAAAPAASPTPIVADPTNPAGFLRYYFDLITNHRDYGDAWLLLTKKYQQQAYPTGTNQYGTYWSTVQRVDLDSVDVLKVDAATVDCHVVMTIHTSGGVADQQTQNYRLTYNSKRQSWMFDVP